MAAPRRGGGNGDPFHVRPGPEGLRGRYLLTVRDGRAACVPTDREPDLSLDVRELGAVYLGGTAPSALVRAGHVRAHRAGARPPRPTTCSAPTGRRTACTGSDG
ncbi:sterol carrier protein domain-containing protein [Catellatospora methionotrophica]|uniref:sterol carrier protein domain-containing protein n=1 Tax=Catellatospora methionotrophica TaxID=121620 RepID=UPI001EF197A1|nr:sterol carrier protein domain-containing protein [Catellatospora methionotrophica]